MGLFDFLKPQWSAVKMTEDDRARRFWLLKAFTSYTAWLRCRDRYAMFVRLMEKQCAEEPVGRLGSAEFARYKSKVEQWVRDGEFPPTALDNLEDDHRTDWGRGTYADALEGLSLYDQGLAKLKQGDRDVFLHKDCSPLELAVNAADRQFTIYYMGGPKGGGEYMFYGKYVPAMRAALLRASEHGFSPWRAKQAMAQLSESSFWTKPRKVRDSTGSKMHMPGARAALREATAHVQDLPAVPVPSEDISVYTGEGCPVFGIYEPQVRDGMMAYMGQGQRAYRYGEPSTVPHSGTTATWKLIWQDTRYLDGVIPDEEKDYFPEDSPPPDFSRLVGAQLANDWRSDQLVKQSSGEPAKYTGTWASQDDLHGRIFWRQGDPLPLHKGVSVDWVFSGV